LPQTGAVDHERGGRLLDEGEIELKPLARGLLSENGAHEGADLEQVGGLGMKLEHAGLDLRKVEDVVDQLEQGQRAFADRLRALMEFSARGKLRESISLKPRMAFIGVRIS